MAKRLKIIDSFVVMIVATVTLASLFPAQGKTLDILDNAAKVAIFFLFFMHGAKLSRASIIAGILHWRLHIIVLTTTFILFPLIGLGAASIPQNFIPPEVMAGFLYLCAMPSTVQMSIAFTSAAGGNVAAAVCAAALSSILGVFLSPFLVAFLINAQSAGMGSEDLSHAILNIMVQLLLPFVVGHLSRPVIGKWVDTHRNWIKWSDNSSILLIVYSSFSVAVVEGLWHKVSLGMMIVIAGICALLLIAVLAYCSFLAKKMHFSHADKITLVFCGSKKSLVNGVSMVNVLFPAGSSGVILLPLMIFHQIQMMVCSFLVTYYRKEEEND